MFYAYREEYKHNDCFKDKTNLCNMYKRKLHKTSKCLWPVYIDLLWNECFFSEGFINHIPKIHRSVLRKITVGLLHFWDVYDINRWEKLAIAVKLCFIENRLEQGYNLRGYFVKITRATINILTIVVIHYFS